jgi:methylated-DNA-[protein]-cysteine S-methyltransferase
VKLYIERIDSPLGTLVLLSTPAAIRGIEFEGPGSAERLAKLCGGEVPVAPPRSTRYAQRLQEYLEGQLHALDDLPVETHGTPFEERVWEAVRRIPVGRTVSYGEIAASVGAPGSARAVGRANGCNPVPLVVPCHRVVGADGTLTGYGGGLDRKLWLLRHERALLA